MWRTSQDSGEPVCRCNDCWRAEGWMPEKQQRGPKPSPKSGGARSSQDQLGAQTKAYISGITKIEGQRCASFCPPPPAGIVTMQSCRIFLELRQ